MEDDSEFAANAGAVLSLSERLSVMIGQDCQFDQFNRLPTFVKHSSGHFIVN